MLKRLSATEIQMCRVFPGASNPTMYLQVVSGHPEERSAGIEFGHRDVEVPIAVRPLQTIRRSHDGRPRSLKE